jgi:hypothetical protein
MNYIKSNFLSFIVIILLAVMFLQRCGGGDKQPIVTSPIITKDTVWIIKDSVVYSKPQIIKTIKSDSIIREYYRIQDTTPYHQLLSRYNELVEKYLQTNILVDSLKIDSLGYVKVTDSLSKNLIVGRTYSYNLKYPLIKETQIIPLKPKNQFYVGGGVSGSREGVINQIDAGLLFKTKRDRIYGARVGLTSSGQINYGVQSYWKISKTP